MKKGKEIVVKEETGLANEEWYQALLEDCMAIKVERTFNKNMEILQGKWEIGERIMQENDQMERKDIYGKRVIESLSIDLGVSTTDLWNCLKFYKTIKVDTFEKVWDKLPEGKNTNWYQTTLWLGGGKEGKEKKVNDSYKMSDILEVLKAWLYDEIGLANEEEIVIAVKHFRKTLVKVKKK